MQCFRAGPLGLWRPDKACIFEIDQSFKMCIRMVLVQGRLRWT
jgi:hypothetical protein